MKWLMTAGCVFLLSIAAGSICAANDAPATPGPEKDAAPVRLWQVFDLEELQERVFEIDLLRSSMQDLFVAVFQRQIESQATSVLEVCSADGELDLATELAMAVAGGCGRRGRPGEAGRRGPQRPLGCGGRAHRQAGRLPSGGGFALQPVGQRRQGQP